MRGGVRAHLFHDTEKERDGGGGGGGAGVKNCGRSPP